MEIAEEGISIVLRGNFNPSILSPGWLLAEKLIGSEDMLKAEVEVIAGQIAAFDLPWARIEAMPDRMSLQTTSDHWSEKLRDLALGILSTLRHTPINGLGINRYQHVRVPDAHRWHAVGDALVPKQPWDGLLPLAGVASLLMQGVRSDDFGGQVLVRVEPSARYQPGIFLEYNDHFTLVTDVQQPTTRDEFSPTMIASGEPSAEFLEVALSILSEHWQETSERARGTLQEVLERTVRG